MPDQHSAADEHALLQEISAPLASLPDDPVTLAANTDFPVVLRGYDRLAVDAYVKKTSQLVAEMQATRSPEAAVRRALERVGGEVAGVLQRAHDTAEQITAQSRREAEERLEVARREATEIVAAAEQRLRDLDAETDRIWAERRRIIDDARELASQLTTLATDAAERFPPEQSTGEHQATAPEDETRADDETPIEDETLPEDETAVLDEAPELDESAAPPPVAAPPPGIAPPPIAPPSVAPPFAPPVAPPPPGVVPPSGGSEPGSGSAAA
jgi:cell division septum initiation protein DivIVA